MVILVIVVHGNIILSIFFTYHKPHTFLFQQIKTYSYCFFINYAFNFFGLFLCRIFYLLPRIFFQKHISNSFFNCQSINQSLIGKMQVRCLARKTQLEISNILLLDSTYS